MNRCSIVVVLCAVLQWIVIDLKVIEIAGSSLNILMSKIFSSTAVNIVMSKLVGH